MSEGARMLPDPGRGLPAKRLAPIPGMDAAMRRCIDLCRKCEAICIEAARHCLARGGRYAEPDFVNLLLACAESCRTSERFMLLRSEFHLTVCGINADVCEAAADDCEAMGTDEVLKRCVEACRRCAASCREMAGRPVSA
jgi:hypothetical protein